MNIYKFGDYYLNPGERRLVEKGGLVKMSSRAFDTLLLLVENHGEVVTKNDLIQKVWRGSFVDEGNIPVHISALRKALCENKSKRLIETVSGIGYRFVSPVQTVSEEAWSEYLLHSRALRQGKNRAKSILNSIAVLPLTNLSSDKSPEVEFLAEGIAENIINSLCSDSNLRILSRDAVFRFSTRTLSAQEIGRRLRVDAVLTGRVRLVGRNLRIGVELIKVEDGSQLWGKQYSQEFSDIFSIQEEVVIAICEHLKLHIERVSKRLSHVQGGRNPEVYRLYLKGKFFLRELGIQSLTKSVKYFQESIFLDPTHVLSYIGLINCYLAFNRHGRSSSEKTLQVIDPLLNYLNRSGIELPEIYTLRGVIRLKLEWDWKRAGEDFRRAIALDPTHVPAIRQYANLLNLMGRSSEALHELKYALELSPLSVSVNTTLARILFSLEQYDRAIKQLREVREVDSSNTGLLTVLSASLIQNGEYEEGISILQTLWDKNKSFEYLAMIGYAHGRRGEKKEARRVLKEMERASVSVYVDFYFKAFVFMSIGEVDLAFQCLDESLKHRDSDIVALGIDPRFSSLRQDRRYNDLMQGIGFSND